ncbi:hypothetical protein C8R45DRAFT_1095055 [Mycena sanguinolenta]|nr:hypothetical protein C8R45DRAFT_1095055 [Mycena sanguinolenta]
MPSNSPGSSTLTHAWTPRLHAFSDDRKIFEAEPFASAFRAFFLSPNKTRSSTEKLWDILGDQLSTGPWTKFAHDWLSFTLGGEIVAHMPEEAIRMSWEVILNVLYLRYVYEGHSDGEEKAHQELLTAQMHGLETDSVSAVPPVSTDDDYNYSDTDNTDDTDTDDEDYSDDSSDYESDGDIDDPIDGTYGDADFHPRPPKESCSKLKFKSPSKSAKLPLELALDRMPARWLQRINVFFNPMRDLSKRQYKSPPFRDALKESGLLSKLLEISKLGNLIETSHSDVETSFRFNNWKITYGELICQWTEPFISEHEYEELRHKPDPQFRFTEQDVLYLFQFISRHQRMHPWIYNPFVAFFLLSLDCFMFHSENWLLPSLRTLGYQRVEGWNPEIVYRTIMATSLLKHADNPDSTMFLDSLADQKKIWCPFIPSSGPPAAVNSQLPSSSSPSPSKGKKRADKWRGKKTWTKTVSAKAEETELGLLDETDMLSLGAEPNACRICQELDMDEKCIRLYDVHEHADAQSFRGIAMTCVPDHEKIQPQSSVDLPIRYANPETLGFKWIKPRPETYERCGKDITRLVWKKEEENETELIGGVRYHALDRETLDQLDRNHRAVAMQGVHRCNEIEAWNLNPNSMTGEGAQQPKGGRNQGDGYGPYACHSGRTPDDIRALFRHAVDNDVLVEVGSTIIPTMKADIKQVTRENETSCMGRYGLTAFTCTSYISAIHPDYNIGPGDVKEGHAQADCKVGAPMMLMRYLEGSILPNVG